MDTKGHHSDGWKGGGMLLGTERKAVFFIKWQEMWLNCVLSFFVEGRPFK